MEKQRKRIEFFIEALKFFKENDDLGNDVYYYADTPRDLLDIFIFNIVITFERYKDWTFDKDFKVIRGEEIDNQIKFLEELKKLTYDETVTILEFNPQEKERRENINKAIDIAVEHATETNVVNRETSDPNVTILIEALAEPEKLEQEFLSEINENVPNREALAKNYVDQIKESESSKKISNIITEARRNEEATVASETSIKGGRFWATPIGQSFTNWGLVQIAKEKPKKENISGPNDAAALKINGHEKELENLMISLQLNPDVVHILTERLNEIRKSTGGRLPNALDFATSTQDLNLSPEQAQILSLQTSGISTFSAYNQVFGQVQGTVINKLLNRVGRQIFGRFSAATIKNNIKTATKLVVQQSLQKAAGFLAGKGLSTLGAIIGNLAPVVGAVIGWIVGKITELILKKFLPWIKKHLNLLLIGAGLVGGYMLAGTLGAVAGGVLGGVAAGAVSGTGTVAAIVGFLGSLTAFVVGAITIPLLITIIGIPIAVALTIFIINSGAYVVPPTGVIGVKPGLVGVICNTTNQTYDSAVANAAACIVSDLDQFGLNPLLASSVNSQSQSWQGLSNILAKPAFDALAISATGLGKLQCVGFVSATAGLAYGHAIEQNHDACGYIVSPPTGYTYIAGTSGIRSGDFFIINGEGGCDVQPNPSPGHIGVVTSVDGALISCADGNELGQGDVRIAHGCFELSQLTGYLRKE